MANYYDEKVIEQLWQLNEGASHSIFKAKLSHRNQAIFHGKLQHDTACAFMPVIRPHSDMLLTFCKRAVHFLRDVGMRRGRGGDEERLHVVHLRSGRLGEELVTLDSPVSIYRV